jgi:hypothetical protein
MISQTRFARPGQDITTPVGRRADNDAMRVDSGPLSPRARRQADGRDHGPQRGHTMAGQQRRRDDPVPRRLDFSDEALSDGDPMDVE